MFPKGSLKEHFHNCKALFSQLLYNKTIVLIPVVILGDPSTQRIKICEIG